MKYTKSSISATKQRKRLNMRLKEITVFMNGERVTFTRKEWIEQTDKFLMVGDNIEVLNVEY